MDKIIISYELRFVFAMLCILIFSIRGKQSTPLNALSALFILLIAFGARNMIYLLASLFLNIFIIKFIKINTYVLTLLNILNIYLYKGFGHLLEPEIQGTYDITGFLMIMTIKMGYVTKSYDNNLSNCLDYILFIPGLLTGPSISYKVFIEPRESKNIKFPVYKLTITVILGLIHVFLKSFEFKNYILKQSVSFPIKLLYLYLYNFGGRAKYHFSWNFADTCFTLRGFPGYLNIDFARVEFCESVREISSNWNKFVSAWVKELFFIPLKDKSIRMAIFVSHLASAVLHGFNLCYFIFTLSFGLYSQPITKANNLIKYRFLRIIQMVGFVSYFSLPFYLLNLKELYQIWKNLYFFGHIYCTFWLLYFNLDRIRTIIFKKTVSTSNEAIKTDISAEKILKHGNVITSMAKLVKSHSE